MLNLFLPVSEETIWGIVTLNLIAERVPANVFSEKSTFVSRSLFDLLDLHCHVSWSGLGLLLPLGRHTLR